MEKKRKKGIVFIIFLIIIVLCLLGYIYYTDYYNPKVKTVTKTKTLTKSLVTEQVSLGIARQTYDDYINIFSKFDKENNENNEQVLINNYEDIMTKYFTKTGREAFEDIYVEKKYIDIKNNNTYLIEKNIVNNCTIEFSEYNVQEFNAKEITYEVNLKKKCTIENDQTEESNSSENITLKYEKKYWKIDMIK